MNRRTFSLGAMLSLTCWLLMSTFASAKDIVFCLDGTGNTAKNAEVNGEDTTNVFRICNLVAKGDHRVILYFNGIGTTGNKFIDKNARRFGLGGKALRKKAYLQLLRTYKPGDKIYFFGFSRGAAIVLDLANYIRRHGVGQQKEVMIHFVGLWDIVGAFGIPIDILGFDTQQLNIGKKLGFPKNIAHAVHLMAIDETRDEFEPTHIPLSKRAKEVWFAGSHGDVGGGYAKRRLADITLLYMINQAKLAGLPFSAAKLARLPKNKTGEGLIRHPDLEVSEGIRAIHVVLPKDGTKTLAKHLQAPRIHSSVFDRMKSDPTYDPFNLKQLENYLVVD